MYRMRGIGARGVTQNNSFAPYRRLPHRGASATRIIIGGGRR